MWMDQRGAQVLPRGECLRLLAAGAGGIGRVAIATTRTSREAPEAVIVPVNYRMLAPDVVFQVGDGRVLDAARHHHAVTFEVDDIDAREGEAWTVIVRGIATEVAPDLVDQARPVDAVPYPPNPGSRFVRVRTDHVTGRRFVMRPEQLPARSGACRVADLDLTPPLRVNADMTLRELAGVLEDRHVTSALVEGPAVAIVTDRDLTGAVAAGEPLDTPVIAVATAPVVWTTPSSRLSEAAEMMARQGIGHLVVRFPSGDVAGVLTMSEALRRLLKVAADEATAGPKVANVGPKGPALAQGSVA
jgi:CBS domain-containing protein